LRELIFGPGRIQLANVRNIPYLEPLPDRINPIFAKAVVFALHEYKHVACLDERPRRLLLTLAEAIFRGRDNPGEFCCV
jgi:hypothetical protein